VRKLVDVAIRIKRKGSRDEGQKEGADRKSADDLHTFPFGRIAIEPGTIIIFAPAAPALSGNGQMALPTHLARPVLSHLTSKCEVIFPSKKEAWRREGEEDSPD
jgi:hypothetical protein